MNKENGMVHKLFQVLHDLLKSFLIGIAAGAAASLILLSAGFIMGGLSLQSGLEAAKDGMLLAGALGLFVLAGMLLVKGKKPEKFTAGNGWNRHFKILGIKSVLGVICAAILFTAAIIDYVMIIL